MPLDSECTILPLLQGEVSATGEVAFDEQGRPGEKRIDMHGLHMHSRHWTGSFASPSLIDEIFRLGGTKMKVLCNRRMFRPRWLPFRTCDMENENDVLFLQDRSASCKGAWFAWRLRRRCESRMAIIGFGKFCGRTQRDTMQDAESTRLWDIMAGGRMA